MAVELVEAFDGILGVDGVAEGNMGTGELGHDLRSTTEAKAVLGDT